MNKEILNNIKKDYVEFWDEDEVWDIDNCYREAYIYGKLIDKYGKGLIKNTNNLWFWLINITIVKYEELFGKFLDEKDKNKIIAVYLDIENYKNIICINEEEQADFEKNNKVIKGKRSINDYSDRYYNARYEFFKLCNEYNQEIAIKTMLEEEKERVYEEIEELYLKKSKSKIN